MHQIEYSAYRLKNCETGEYVASMPFLTSHLNKPPRIEGPLFKANAEPCYRKATAQQKCIDYQIMSRLEVEAGRPAWPEIELVEFKVTETPVCTSSIKDVDGSIGRFVNFITKSGLRRWHDVFAYIRDTVHTKKPLGRYIFLTKNLEQPPEGTVVQGVVRLGGKNLRFNVPGKTEAVFMRVAMEDKNIVQIWDVDEGRLVLDNT